jgi:hypothetical protein
MTTWKRLWDQMRIRGVHVLTGGSSGMETNETPDIMKIQRY